MGLLPGEAVSCALPAPLAPCTAQAGGAAQKGPEMMWVWPTRVQVAGMCQPSPMGIHRLAVDGGAQAEAAGSSLLSHMCCVYTRRPSEPVAEWLYPGAQAPPLAALSVGVLQSPEALGSPCIHTRAGSGVTMGPCFSAEHPQGPVPTLWNEPPELASGAGPMDTTTARLSDATAFPLYTSELEPEDTTHLHRLDAGDGTWRHHGCSGDQPRLRVFLLCSCFLWACCLPRGV